MKLFVCTILAGALLSGLACGPIRNFQPSVPGDHPYSLPPSPLTKGAKWKRNFWTGEWERDQKAEDRESQRKKLEEGLPLNPPDSAPAPR